MIEEIKGIVFFYTDNYEFDVVGFEKENVTKIDGIYKVNVNFKEWVFMDKLNVRNVYYVEEDNVSYMLLDNKKYDIRYNNLSLAEYELKEVEEIKIYRQYPGHDNLPYYYTFDENNVNMINRKPWEVSLTKENIVLTILDTQIQEDNQGNYYGNEYIKNKTEGMKLKKVDLMIILWKCYELYKELKRK
ncbi:hypothetical protein [Clostridium botulinum]|uniref:hypothetical protein n=1 Tax=Clostridium botulinum TaxID=1491 RepID=UPI000773FEB1|nr:hypothetical protein [Clostridium botulinum]MBN3411216.1 hypothetical protein [Clostridium botulinum]